MGRKELSVVLRAASLAASLHILDDLDLLDERAVHPPHQLLIVVDERING